MHFLYLVNLVCVHVLSRCYDFNCNYLRSNIASNPDEDRAQAAKLLANITGAVHSLLASSSTKLGSNGGDEPPTKRAKSSHEVTADPHQIWIGNEEDPPHVAGHILVQLTTAGLINALAGTPLVNSKLVTLSPQLKLDSPVGLGNMTYRQLRQVALALHRRIQTRVESDFLVTTPARIHDMLCSDLAPQEFKAVKKRVYDTVIEGKGRNNSQEDEDDLPVAARAIESDLDKDKKCPVCGNSNQAEFTLDRKNGDIICTNCGTVVMESLMHEGSQFRKFEGEVDRNHHGDAPNKLFSNAHNMATTLGGIQITSTAGGPGFGTQKKGIEQILRNANAYTELNISKFGNRERKTRIGYKDRQKKDAFKNMIHVGDALHLHEAVVERAKEIFAGFRDDRELVQSLKAVICACLTISFEELSQSGVKIMKQRQEQNAEALLSNRANRRNELHNASMAGKGGLLLDFSKVEAEKEEGAISAIEKKPASAWDLDDCRSWLLEASRNIAQQWLKDRKQGKPNVPSGSQEELEGKLVEHTIALCDQLEEELRARDAKGRGKGITPRVKEMGHLSIRWQHGHERGSGGKGGIGNSGRAANGVKSGEQSGRTAGQLLILKTGKKLRAMLKDTVAGDTFHRELRALVGRQDARKQKERREQAARQRFQQMKRKPWLQAKANEVDK